MSMKRARTFVEGLSKSVLHSRNPCWRSKMIGSQQKLPYKVMSFYILQAALSKMNLIAELAMTNRNSRNRRKTHQRWYVSHSRRPAADSWCTHALTSLTELKKCTRPVVQHCWTTKWNTPKRIQYNLSRRQHFIGLVFRRGLRRWM